MSGALNDKGSNRESTFEKENKITWEVYQGALFNKRYISFCW